MPANDHVDMPFTKREWQHLTGVTAADGFAYLTLLLLGAIYFCADPVGDALLAGGAIVASLISFVLGWRHEPECSDLFNAVILLAYPPVPLITMAIVGLLYSREIPLALIENLP